MQDKLPLTAISIGALRDAVAVLRSQPELVWHRDMAFFREMLEEWEGRLPMPASSKEVRLPVSVDSLRKQTCPGGSLQADITQALTSPMPHKTLAVIGVGTIGSSWISLFPAKGYTVRCYDAALTQPASAVATQQACRAKIDANWEVLTRRGEVSEHANQDAISFHGSIAECVKQVDFVQENVPEEIMLKQQILSEIDLHTPPGVLVASSTSCIPRDLLVLQSTVEPDRIVIGHPLQPHINHLVEVRVADSNPAIMVALKEVYEHWMGMKMIIVNKDVTGHIYNRLMGVLTKEAIQLVNSGVCTSESVDEVTKQLGKGLQVGLARHMIIIGGPDYKAGGPHAVQRIAVNRVLTNMLVSRSAWMYRLFGDHWLTRGWICFLQQRIVPPMASTLDTVVKLGLGKFFVYCDAILDEQTSWKQFMTDIQIIYATPAELRRLHGRECTWITWM